MKDFKSSGLLTPNAPFQAVRDGQFTMPRFVDVDLTSARTEDTALEIPIAGNVLYADADANNGVATIEFNDVGRDSTDAPFTARPGFIANIPFTRIRVYNAAQPGKKIRIIYGVDIPFQPGSVGSLSVDAASIDLIRRPLEPTASFTNIAAQLANTATVALAPAGNTNGVVVTDAALFSYNSATAQAMALIAKSSPPANLGDGQVLALYASQGGGINPTAQLSSPAYVAPGLGLYFFNVAAESGHAGLMKAARWRVL